MFYCVNVKPICGPVYLLYPTNKTPPQEKIYGAFLSGQAVICSYLIGDRPQIKIFFRNFLSFCIGISSQTKKLRPRILTFIQCADRCIHRCVSCRNETSLQGKE